MRFIGERIRAGLVPSLREIGAHFGIRSTNGVSDHLLALQRKGYIDREWIKSRAMRLTMKGDEVCGIDSVTTRQRTELLDAVYAAARRVLDGQAKLGELRRCVTELEAFDADRRAA